MRIYVIGTGGVGGYLGGKLANAGNDVTFVARGEFYDVMKKDGLTVKTTDGKFVINPVQVIDNISKIENPDLVIVSVKTYDTQNVAQELNKYISSKTNIITFQNGIQNDLQLKKYIIQGNVYPGVAYIISSKEKPGVISQTGGLKRFIFGDRTKANSSELKQIEKIFNESGIDTIFSDDIEAELWKKYIFINAFSGFTALCRSDIGKILSNDFVYDLYKRCVKESISVADKLKINLPKNIFEDVINITDNTAPNSKSSLLIDIENHRKNEIETLNGTLVNIAKEHSIDVPINETIYFAIKLLGVQ